MKRKYINFLVIPAIAVAMASCGGEKDKNGKELSTPSSGTLNMAADETLQSIVDSEKQVFETLYPKAHLSIVYQPEVDLINGFINDSVLMIILPRQLNQQEQDYFKSIKVVPRESKIASDAIALIVHKENPDTTFELSQVREIMRGKITNWNQLDASSKIGPLNLIFDNNKSSTVRYMSDLVGQKDLKGDNFYALKSNKEVIDYVSKNKGALGIIGINWISDQDDSSTVRFKQNIKVIGIKGDPGDKGDDYYYQPYQAYIATQQYPLIREIYSISREPRTGLATGFASFIAGDKGQKIILKSGLLPAHAPIRIIQLQE